MALNQSNRLIRMTKGPLGADEVVVTSFSGREAISYPFDFEIEFLSTHLDLRPGKIIGNELDIELDRRDRDGRALTPRYFHGYVNRFAAGPVVFKEGGEHKYRRYRLGMVPWLWFLSKTARCYLFFPEKEDKSIFEVIEAVFNRAKSLHINPVSDLKGISDLKNRKVKHCVQYRESDFNFVARTMEKYGVFYYFRFEKGKHTLVLDMKKNYPVCEEAEVMFPRLVGGQSIGDHITGWEHDYAFVSGKWSHTDYNFEVPSTRLKASVPRLPSVDLAQNDKYEVYDYPGDFSVQPDGETAARWRQEQEEVQHDLVDGASTCRTFTPGYKFKLTAHPDRDAVSEQGKSYLLTSVTHAATQSSDDTGDTGGAGYNNRFTCIVDSVQFRPPRVTPRPVIGVQTAEVVGPAGEEIYTEKHGRVKVQFHWDREGKKDENSSCWIRVSHPWAGKGWGSVSIPRIGQEVIVDFLEGDPDNPIVTGRVYNGEKMAPYSGGVVSGLKSNTHKGKGYNEMSMDDAAGKEKITIHAQYDMGTTVEHDDTQTVNNNRVISVVGTHTEDVKGETKITIKEGNYSHDVATGTATHHVKAAVITTYDAALDLTVTGAVTEIFKAEHKQEVTKTQTITVDGNIAIESKKKITLTVEGSSITIDSSGVTISAPMIKLN